ncbi:efflux RND transporter permease subunit [Falsihalocynthiibacter sp. SS001]|uniref:efflux RND transporter permease subunit n=1 Tax=Falsihalocynthiibacter sp. SS001 TaxID=3349698 RepID=UPI0036D407FC
MTGIVDWASERARMVIAFIVISLVAGAAAYVNLPKEGEPDIEIPALFVSVPFPGISAEDSEALLVKPMETELSDLDGLKTMTSTASEGYGGIALEFEFGWDKTKIIADVRDKMNTVEGNFPAGADKYSINEINFSEFPIIIVNLSGDLPERTLVRVGKQLQDKLEGLEPVLEAALAGHRDEMVEVTIDPLRLEAYNVTAPELINVVVNNNQLIAAGEIETPNGAFSVKIPSSFGEPQDIFDLPVKTNGDRVVTLGDLADIRLTFEDRVGTARYNGETTVALQVVKRKGFNIIDTAAQVRAAVEESRAGWPEQLRAAVEVGASNDQSRTVGSMVSQLEGSVLTAIALVMIVVLGTLGTRSALLVGFSIPTSFLLCFVLLGAMGITISNIVMFGLILAVGMLVDGAIVVVEYADRRIKEGVGPMHAFTEAAKRMFWPIVSSTATTLCAFLPMLFWPGVAGQFMGMLPVTLIFVLSASLVVALVYLPVLGGVFGRGSRIIENASAFLKRKLPWFVRAALIPVAFYGLFLGIMQMLNPGYLFGGTPIATGVVGIIPGALLFMISAFASSAFLGAASLPKREKKVRAGVRRSPFGIFIKFIVGNPIMPLVAVGSVIFVVLTTFSIFGENNKGVEFFVDSEPEQAIIYVRQRGNLSLEEKDDALRLAEDIVLKEKGIQSTFAFAGDGGLTQFDGGAGAPRDSIGQIQIELMPWEERPTIKEPWFWGLKRNAVDPEYDGNAVLERLEEKLAQIPGTRSEILNLSRGPASAKPVHLRLKSDNWESLRAATEIARAQFDVTPGLADIDDTLPLPGIDWQIDVDVQKAGRYGADVATVGGMVQLVTRGILLDTMRVDSSDEEIEIRVRLPEEDRVLSTLDSLRIRTTEGLVPLSNFITRQPVEKLAQIDRVDQQRYFDVKAGIASNLLKLTPTDPDDEAYFIAEKDLGKVANDGETYQSKIDAHAYQAAPVNANERIEALTEWLNTQEVLPDDVTWEWTGDQEDQAESGAFLMRAFAGALALMFVILLAQFNSFYNSLLVLVAVVLSTTGVLIGMLVMNQAFSIIMTGTGIVALAGIVVNNNIVLIDTYQEYAKYMPRIEAIVRTAQNRIRPVLLTTITTMAGLAPMMFGLSLDFINGGYSIDSPTALWWKQLATAVVFGLGIATVLTLVFTPSMLAIPVWFKTYVSWIARLLAKLSMGRSSQAAHDWALQSAAKKLKAPELDWTKLLENDVKHESSDTDEATDTPKSDGPPLKAAE